MLLITSSSPIMKHKLVFITLSANLEYLPMVTRWVQQEWRSVFDINHTCERFIQNSIDCIYVATFSNRPVGMFILSDYPLNDDLLKAARGWNRLTRGTKLMAVCIEKDYRGLGFGRQIIEEAKKLSTECGATFLLLETSNPKLNRMYEKHGAKVICDPSTFDVLKIKLHPKYAFAEATPNDATKRSRCIVS